MTRQGLILLAFVLMSLIVGFMAGYRFRISQEIVVFHPRKYLPPVPPELAQVDAEFSGYGWTWIAPLPDVNASGVLPVPEAPVPATPVPFGGSHAGSGERRRGAHHISGVASWHATGRSGLYAAACRPLRVALGKSWRGRHVLIVSGKRGAEVTLNDWCGSRTKLLDASDELFRYLCGPLSRGVCKVTVGW